jgi:hypothetical protein
VATSHESISKDSRRLGRNSNSRRYNAKESTTTLDGGGDDDYYHHHHHHHYIFRVSFCVFLLFCSICVFVLAW